jgi:hypothetical protein
MSTEVQRHQKGKYGWNLGIPPLDPVDPRHSVSLVMIAQAKAGYESSKRVVDKRFTDPEEKARYNIVWDDTGESVLSMKEWFEQKKTEN